MKNPFEYGSIVESNAFCNRRQELHDLVRAIDNNERMFLYAERRMGKTSLIKRVLGALPTKNHATAYIDLWATDSEISLISEFASTITEATNSTPQKTLEFARDFFDKIVPTVSLDQAGQPQVSFSVARDREMAPTLSEVLMAPGKIAASIKKKLVIVLDEFQQIFDYETDLVERQLRTAMQQQIGVAYILSGSRKHLIQKMVLDKSRPLYRAGTHYSLGPIASEHWLGFVRDKFDESDKHISDDQVEAVCRLTQGHPFYTQHFCHALWELTEDEGKVTDDLLSRALDTLLAREDYAYSTLWEALPLAQRRLLEGLAMEPRGAKIFSADFLERYELRSASTSQRAVKGLLERDIVDQETEAFYIVDRFFHLWIQRKHS
jgi:hypothetical protein